MAALNDIFTEALKIIRKSDQVRITKAASDYFEVDYEDLNTMLSDAQLLNYRGFTTKINRKFIGMTVSI